jgi:hypothetical protein
MIDFIDVYELPDLPDNEEFNARFPNLDKIRVEFEDEEDDHGNFYFIFTVYVDELDICEYLTYRDRMWIADFLEGA